MGKRSKKIRAKFDEFILAPAMVPSGYMYGIILCMCGVNFAMNDGLNYWLSTGVSAGFCTIGTAVILITHSLEDRVRTYRDYIMSNVTYQALLRMPGFYWTEFLCLAVWATLGTVVAVLGITTWLIWLYCILHHKGIVKQQDIWLLELQERDQSDLDFVHEA